MKPGQTITGLLIGMILGGAPWLAAQSRLYVQEAGKDYHGVVRMEENLPVYLTAEGPVRAKGRKYALRKVEEYAPVVVAVRNQKSGVFKLTLDRNNALGTTSIPVDLNQEFTYAAEFEADELLEHVFLVLELEFNGHGSTLFAYEVGRLEPRKPHPFSLTVPLSKGAAEVRTQLHLFAGGEEVMTSEMPVAEREAAFARMIRQRLKDVRQAGPRRFCGPPPEYPAAWRATGTQGRAVVTIRITPQGTVQDAVVQSASAPAFGEAALAAVQRWRFLPRVVDGQPVETRVSIPFTFDPPAGAAP